MYYRDLKVWEKAHTLTKEVYELTSYFPKDEKYGLTSQLRRAASSMPANIAEGSASLSKNMFIKHLGIARGSSAEVEYHLLLCFELGYMSHDKFDDCSKRIFEIQKMLNGLINSLRD